MHTRDPRPVPVAHKAEHVDVLIVGAGIWGVGGAYHLTKQCPGVSFVVLESKASFDVHGELTCSPRRWRHWQSYPSSEAEVAASARRGKPGISAEN